MAYFPLFINLKCKRILLLGGGPVALSKAKTLIQFGCQITVLSRDFIEGFETLPDVRCMQREFEESDLDGITLCVCAAGDQALDETVSQLCQKRQIPVNVADIPELCTFFFPSLIVEDPIVVGISTGGNSPRVAAFLRRHLEWEVPDYLAKITAWLGSIRKTIVNSPLSPKQRRHLFDALFGQALDEEKPLTPLQTRKFVFEQTGLDLFAPEGDEPLQASLRKEHGEAALDDAQQTHLADTKETNLTPKEINLVPGRTDVPTKTDAPEKKAPGEVILAGAGCGDDSWLTLQTAGEIEQADVVLYDNLVDASILERIDPAKAVDVGKRGGQKSARQEDICMQMETLAREGKRVLRLKGGDPFLFGRGLEEKDWLEEKGIPARVLPGLSSALSIPLKAGISLTDRRYARSVGIVSAHGSHGFLKTKLEEAAHADTLVILMGIHYLKEIQQTLLESGKSAQTPCAILCTRTDGQLEDVRCTLGQMEQMKKQGRVFSPAVIVIGQAASWNRMQNEPSCQLAMACSDEFSSAFTREFGEQAQMTSVLKCRRTPRPNVWKEVTDFLPEWIVFTSAYGVDLFFEQMKQAKGDHRALGTTRFACIGPATAAALEKHGYSADFIPSQYNSKTLAKELSRETDSVGPFRPWTKSLVNNVVILQSSLGDSILEETLKENNHVKRIDLYDLSWQKQNEIPDGADALILSCSSAAKEAAAFKDYQGPVFAISKKTAQAWAEQTGRMPLYPETATAADTARLVREYLTKSGRLTEEKQPEQEPAEQKA